MVRHCAPEILDTRTRVHRELTALHRVPGDIDALERAIHGGCGGRRSAAARGGDIEIVRADAVRDPLPAADVAFSLCMAHHLAEDELAAMIRNVGRPCRRFLRIDLARHPLSHTTAELARIADAAGVRRRHSVALIYANQTLDIAFRPPPRSCGPALLH